MRFAHHFIHVVFLGGCTLLVFFCMVESTRLSELNEPCVLVNECRIPAYFCGANRTCQCAKKHAPNQQMTICIGAIGEKCRYDSHCGIGAYCSPKEVCECQDEYPYAYQDGFACTDDAAATRTVSSLVTIALAVIFVGNFIS